MEGTNISWRENDLGKMIYEKLDRVLCNEEWRLEIPDVHVKVLTRVIFYDHRPILIVLDTLQIYGAQRQLKFKSAWLLI